MDSVPDRSAGISLLIVDDEPAICRLIASVAGELGYSSCVVHDGQAFKDTCANSDPQVIVLDLGIPGDDGIELLRFLADRKCGAEILIISGHGERVLESARRLGGIRGLKIGGVIGKPIRRADLREHLEKARYGA